MFTVEKVHMDKSAGESSQTINLNSRRECEDIMDAIYKENPSYWPYGLSIGSHDGGVYMIREASTKRPVGFTGWQERDEEGQRVGYYSIGILSDYRNNGYAKQAVAKLIKIKSASVDRVQALVMRHNKPSLALAEKLGIPVIKEGSVKSAVDFKTIAKVLGLGAGGAGFMDAVTYGRNKSWDEYKNTPFTTSRIVNDLANAGLAGAAGVPGLPGSVRAGLISSIPVKDLALAATPEVSRISDSLHKISETPPSRGILDSLSPTQKMVGGGLGLAGLLGAGYLGTKAVQSLKDMSNAQRQNAGGRIKVTLPTKDPNDEETTMDIPMEDLEVSRSQQTKLLRDLRRKIRRESKERTMRRTMGHFLPDAGAKTASLKKIQNLLNLIYG